MSKIILGIVIILATIVGVSLTLKHSLINTQDSEINTESATPTPSPVKSSTIPLANKNNYLFEYIEQTDGSKFTVLGKVIDAWKVNVQTKLLTDHNNKTITLNLMDGINYEIIRGDAYLKNSYDKINCSVSKCGWSGYYNDGSISKNLETGETRPANWLNIQIEDTAIIASFAPMVEAYKHINYQLRGEENNYYLLKIDTSEVRIEQ